MQTHGGDVIAAILKNHGVEHLFTLCGGHISPILVGCKQLGIRIVDVRNEATAVFAADAVARRSGGVGVAVVTAGPGVTNTVTALKNAQMAHSPVVLLGGAAATVLAGRGALQDIGQLSLMRPVCKYVGRIRRIDRIVPVLERAVREARSGVPGPVFVECPIDLLYEEALVREWYGIKAQVSGRKRLKDRLLQGYLNFHLSRMFAGDLHRMTPQPQAVRLPLPKADRIDTAVGLVRSARRPVLIVGSQAMLQAEKVPRLAKAVAQLGLPVYLAGMARGLLGRNHPLQMRHRRKEALKAADLVILAGMPCDFRLNYGRSINSGAELIAVNRSKADLFLNRRPSLAIPADPLETLCALADAFEKTSGEWGDWVEGLRQADVKREAEISEMAAAPVTGVNPMAFLLKLESFLADRSILVADGGDFVATAAYTLRPRGPLSWLDPGVFGTLGVGAGFAIGAQLSDAQGQVWLLYGDGAAGYSLPEFDTFVRHGLPIIAVVGNDAGWAQIARDQVKFLKDDIATVLRPTDYHLAAEGLGGKGFLIRTDEEILPVLDAAGNAARQGQPVLINVIIGKTGFREGSISV